MRESPAPGNPDDEPGWVPLGALGPDGLLPGLGRPALGNPAPGLGSPPLEPGDPPLEPGDPPPGLLLEPPLELGGVWGCGNGVMGAQAQSKAKVESRASLSRSLTDAGSQGLPSAACCGA